MKDKLAYLETESRKYPLAMNLNVMDEIQNEYGTFDKWLNVFNDEEEPKIKDIKFGFMVMINEGIDIENEESASKGDYTSLDSKAKYVTLKQVGRILTEVGIKESAKTMRDITVSSLTDSEADEKNGSTTKMTD